MARVTLNYFSDVMCVWAYVSQIKIDELLSNYGEKVILDYAFFPVFDNALEKIDMQWEHRGGRKAYSEHVKSVVRDFSDLEVADSIWIEDPPCSSLPAHLYMEAVKSLEQREKVAKGSFNTCLFSLRKDFFSGGINISTTKSLQNSLEKSGMDVALVQAEIDAGIAYTAMARDARYAVEHHIKVSPTLILNDDRQRLCGNVGYRIIDANVRELIERPEPRFSWC